MTVPKRKNTWGSRETKPFKNVYLHLRFIHSLLCCCAFLPVLCPEVLSILYHRPGHALYASNSAGDIHAEKDKRGARAECKYMGEA